MLACRGVRGATVAAANTREAIIESTQELLLTMVEANEIRLEDISCIFFTTSPDLTASFPAAAARQLGWTDLALLCGHEMNVPDALERCVRVLLLWNTERSQREIVHCYLKEAVRLRPERDVQSTWISL